MNRSSCRFALLIPLAFACFALSPQARAICQQGCSIINNTFLGDDALLNNTGLDNTAVGFDALYSNTTGSYNTANGNQALISNTTGGANTAIGAGALYFNTTGDGNTATGFEALASNGLGNTNTAFGGFALSGNTSGDNNTATGRNALSRNTTGSFNVALGTEAGGNLTTGSNNIDIANRGVTGEANTIRIGTSGAQTAAFVAGIHGVPITGGTAIGVNASGQLGVKPSSVRYKEAIRPMDKASEAILALEPVTFRYTKELDPKGAPQFGLVAEEVAKVNPDLVVADDQGKPFTVRYEEVNAMLLNEFLKEHRKVEEQGATIMHLKGALQATATRQQKQIEALTAGLQKVTAQLEVTKPAPQLVNNP